MKIEKCLNVPRFLALFGVSLVEAKLCTIESGDPIINSVHNYVYFSWTRYIYIHHIIKKMKDGEL